MAKESDSQIYLVRHAEKQADGTRNPSLTDKGKKRAILLAQMLADKQIKTIYSTGYNRTLETAQPLAEKLSKNIELYDPRKLGEFAQMILQVKGSVLIVGHSNTTPQLVELLGAGAQDVMDESVYNRLYLVEIIDSQVTSKLIEFNLAE